MSTKIILNITEGLTRQEMDDLRHLFADALSTFAVARTPAVDYTRGRYPNLTGNELEDKVRQVMQRTQLAAKLHPYSMTIDYEHVLPHTPTPIMEYYKACEEDDLSPMTAALDFLPAAQFGERQGWLVMRDQGILFIMGPDDQRAFWHEMSEQWQWLKDGDGPAMVLTLAECPACCGIPNETCPVHSSNMGGIQ